MPIIKIKIVRRRRHIEQGGDIYWTALLPTGDTIGLSWPNSIAAFQGFRRYWKSLNNGVGIQINF